MIKFPSAYQKQAAAFFELYDVEEIAASPAEEMTGLKEAKNRVCRFCGKRFGQVTFRSKAHIFPELLGNKYLISDVECDSCNHKLGIFDDHLGNFIGLVRTLFKTTGKNGIPTLFSNNGKMKAGKEIILNNRMIKLGSTCNSSEQIRYDHQNGTFTLSYLKKS